MKLWKQHCTVFRKLGYSMEEAFCIFGGNLPVCSEAASLTHVRKAFQNSASILKTRTIWNPCKTALGCITYASFCQTTAVTVQDCEQYTLCRDCISAPDCVWCSVSTAVTCMCSRLCLMCILLLCEYSWNIL